MKIGRDRSINGRTHGVGREAARSPRHCRRHDSDRGISYVEVLVTVVLLGIAGVAVLGAAAGASKGATTQRAVADMQLVLASTADALTGVAPVPCTGATAAYQVLADARLVQLDLKRGWTTANVTVTDMGVV